MNSKELSKRRAEAMPEVKALVKKYGRRVVNGCLARIAQAEKGQKKLEAMRREVAELEKKLGS